MKDEAWGRRPETGNEEGSGDRQAGRDQRKEVGLDIQRCDRRGDRDELFNDTGAGIRDLESRD